MRKIYVWVAALALLLLAACETPPTPTLVSIDDLLNTATAISRTLEAYERTASPTVGMTPTPTLTPTDEPTPTIAPTATPAATLTPTVTPTPTQTLTPTPLPYQPSPEALEIVAGINAWRVRNGAWPVQPVEILDNSAQTQADYLGTLASIPFGSEMHQGPNGQSSRDRALAAGWPSYEDSSVERVTVNEIAYVGAGPAAALTWWNGSSIHFQTAINFTFREVGVGVAPHTYGGIFIVVLGSRPGVIPTLYDPASNLIYLGQEEALYRIYTDEIQTITHYQALESADAELVEENWTLWTATIPAPEGPGPYYIAYLDGDLRTTIVEVDPAVDIAWFPENLPDADN